MPSYSADLEDALTRAAATGLSAALVKEWSDAVDAAMTAELASLDRKALPVRVRIRTAVLARLAILPPHNEVARQAARGLAKPIQSWLFLGLLARTADAIWRAAGDTTTDFNWYSKRTILAAVYATTEIAWFGDDTPDGSATARFLDARIENVLQYEKLKARVCTACQPTRTSLP